MRILVAVEAVDGRKGIDSLAHLFRGRAGTSIRILVYDGQGF
jgi:transposase